MKTLTLAALSGLALCVAACEDKSPPAAPKPAATPTKSAAPAETPKSPAGGLIEAAKEGAPAALSDSATADLRDKAVAALSGKYDEFKMQIITLQDKAKEVPAAAQAAFASAMTQLSTLTKDVEGKLGELKHATGEAVKTLQGSIDAAWPKIQEQLSIAEKALKGG